MLKKGNAFHRGRILCKKAERQGAPSPHSNLLVIEASDEEEEEGFLTILGRRFLAKTVNDMTPFFSAVNSPDIQREKNKARELRRSEWWKRKRASGICHYCQQQFLPTELTMDHLIPLVRGGKSTRGNIVPACKECNNKKKYALPWEWEVSE